MAPAGSESGSHRGSAVVLAFIAWYAYGIVDEPSASRWTQHAFVAITVLLAASAFIRWKQPRPDALRLSNTLIALAAVAGLTAAVPALFADSDEDKWAGVVYQLDRKGTPTTAVLAETLPKGMTRRQLLHQLGPPAGHGIQRLYDEPDMPCLVYRPASVADRRDFVYAFCLREGRYAALRKW